MEPFTPSHVRAVYDALGLDHDLTLGVSITPGYIHITTAQTDEHGAPIVTGGVLQRTSTGHDIEEEA